MLTVLTARQLRPDLVATIEAAAPGVRLLVSRDREEFRRLLPEADVAYGGRVRADELPLARRLRWIHADTAGVDDWPFAALKERDVVVTNSRGLNARTVADHTLLLMLALLRDFPACVRNQAERRWAPAEPVELAGLTLGIVGYGHLGREIARRGLCAGMRVAALRRGTQGANDWNGEVEVLPAGALAELLPRADVLVLACPLTDETRGLIDARTLRRMKPSAYLINVARGEVVVERDLAQALREGWIAGAGLDVFAEEPLPPESPLWRLPNAIVTPHVAGLLRDYDGRAVALFRDNLRRFAAGEPLLNVVDLDRGY